MGSLLPNPEVRTIKLRKQQKQKQNKWL